MQQQQHTNGQATTAAAPLPEAPASATMKIEYRGYEILFTLRDHSGAYLLQKVDAAITALEGMGAQPAPVGRGRGSAGDGNGGKRKSQYIPIGSPCPTHGGELRRGQYSYYCPRKGDDGEWCNVRTRSLSE